MSTSGLIYALNQQITGTGSLGVGNVKDESKVRFVITNAGVANLIRVRARLFGQVSWTTLVDYTGNTNTDVDVFTWDEIEVLCLVFHSSSNVVNILATSFDSQAGTTYTLPDSSQVEGSVVSFTSSDSSVTITGNPSTNEIDFSVALGSVSKYSEDFNATSDWTLNVDQFEIEVLEATHNKGLLPFVMVLDSNEDLVEVFTNIDTTTGDVLISVPTNPDLRFEGKIIIL